MGLHQSTLPSRPNTHIHFEQQNWQLLQKSLSNPPEMGSFSILRNAITHQVVRSYTLRFDNQKDFDVYVQEFDHWRAMAHWNVIHAKYLIVEKETFGPGSICSTCSHLQILLENPVVTLSQIKDIPVPQSLYILLSALVGFQHLFQLFSYFSICQNMITINQFGLVKVWVNPDLSKNRPNYLDLNNPSQQNMQNPTRFINQLIQLIENSTDYREIPNTFHEFLYMKQNPKNALTFSNCRKLLLNFAEDNKLDIPNSLRSILDLLFEKTNRSQMSQPQNFIDQQHYSSTLYGKNYAVGGYLLDGELNNKGQDSLRQRNEFSSQEQSNPVDNKFHSRGEMIESFQQYPQTNQEISHQVNRIVQRTKSNDNQTPSQSSNPISPRQISHKKLGEAKYFVGFQSQSSSPASHYENSHNYQYSHGLICTNAYYNTQQKVTQLPLIINFSQNSEMMSCNDNPYHSLVQRQAIQRQSTIREQPQEDSLLTSNPNSKFRTSRDLRRASNQLKQTYTNMQTHRHKFSSHSESKPNIDNSSPRQVNVRKELENIPESVQNYQKQTKFSGKSIEFYTPNQMKEIDAQIAEDLEHLMISLRQTKQTS